MPYSKPAEGGPPAYLPDIFPSKKFFPIGSFAPILWLNRWEMTQFQQDKVFQACQLLERIKCDVAHAKAPGDSMFANREHALSENIRFEIAKALAFVQTQLEQIGLQQSARTCMDAQGVIGAIKHHDFSNVQAFHRLDEISRAIKNEMSLHVFLYIAPDRADWYTKPCKGWEDVLERFPRAQQDVEECARCFACDRYAGAVFHAMLILEVGVVEVGKAIEMNDPKLGWQSVSREVDRIVNRSKYSDLKPAEQKHYSLLQEINPLMLAIKDSWRNKIAHVENKLILLSGNYASGMADDIIRNTRAFMLRLALGLAQKGTT